MFHLITGAAGFVGANLVFRLLEKNARIVAVDNLSATQRNILAPLEQSGRLNFRKVDCADLEAFRDALRSCAKPGEISEVWHMAANSDIAAGVADPNIDLRNTFLTTFNTLALMKEFSVPVIHFASSSAVYGDLGETEIGEEFGPCMPISNYGAMKLASEAQICAATEQFVSRANILRFPNVVGAPATHGVVFDLIRKLKHNREWLEVLGDGQQRKIYLHVTDLIDAVLFISRRAHGRVNFFNIGPKDHGVTVGDIAKMVCATVAPDALIRFQGGLKGWPGDVPIFRYSTKKLEALGWSCSRGSEDAIRQAIREIAAQIERE